MIVLLGLAMVMAACDQDSYCLDCKKQNRDGGVQDGGDGDAGDSGPVTDAGPPPDACVVSGVEVCDGIDNDCNGQTDDNVPEVGNTCQENALPPCTPGTLECVGGQLICGGGAVTPQSETCNNVDDDCDGTVDDGNPGGGLLCGTAEGDCQQGVSQCMNGSIQCVGEVGPSTESCDNRDNDCDGMVDDGNPGGGASCGTNTGACTAGTITCSGGVLRCEGSVGATLETCNMVDDDCDGMTDEGFNLLTDRRNCGSCGNNCTAPNATTQCAGGTCDIAFCAPGFFDVNDDGNPATMADYLDGCEYACDFRGNEICNGLDDDCDGQVDENLAVPTGVCLGQGACAATTITCGGAAGWQCGYPATVSTDGMGNIVPESNCDNIDNDCDGDIDEAFPSKGAACTDSGVGICQGTGTNVCNAMGTGLRCNITTPGQTALPNELCNGKDDNCNGTTDENATDNWIDISGGSIGANHWIYKYEASRPNATAASQGTLATRSCSNPNVLPWTDVTFPQAEAACTAAGGRLCTEAEWQRACQTNTEACTWSYNATCTTYSGTKCNGNDFDFDSGTAGDQDGLEPTQFMANCFANWGSTTNRIFDMSGNAKEWTQAAAGDPANTRRLRGGSYNNTRDGIACAFRFAVADNTFHFPNVGFRCCRSTAP